MYEPEHAISVATAVLVHNGFFYLAGKA